MEWSPEHCRALAAEKLAAQTDRWAHVSAVGAAAQDIVAQAPLPDVVVCAAWLHDIGYADSVEQSGLHALDGARLLASLGAPAELVSLVAYHSGAEYEADERGLGEPLRAFARPQQVTLDAITWADMTRGVTGSRISVADRLADILDRYPRTHPVHRAVLRSRTYLIECATRAEQRLAVSR